MWTSARLRQSHQDPPVLAREGHTYTTRDETISFEVPSLVYIKVGEDFADGELSKLEELLDLLDSRLVLIRDAVGLSRDSESDGLTDRGEYLIGVGLCAIQQYVVDTLTFTGVGKGNALGVGPMTDQNISFVAALNAGANWWKHEAEWFAQQSVPSQGKMTFDIVTRLSGESRDYPLAGLLSALLPGGEFSLSGLMPGLRTWRAEVDRMTASKSVTAR